LDPSSLSPPYDPISSKSLFVNNLAHRGIPYGNYRNIPDAENSKHPLETACSKLYLSSARLGILLTIFSIAFLRV
jgi:hypothetical protein